MQVEELIEILQQFSGRCDEVFAEEKFEKKGGDGVFVYRIKGAHWDNDVNCVVIDVEEVF